MTSAVEIHELRKTYMLGRTEVGALRGVSLDVHRGTFVAIMGASGSGKSTLLHCMGGLDRPTAGMIRVDGTALDALSEEELTIYRRRRIGVIFQFFNLLPELTLEDNVAVPLMLDGARRDVVRERVGAALASVGLGARVGHYPGELSGGELQRAAIARALAVEPALVLADEPTGNLDSSNGKIVLDLLRRACDEQGRTIVMVTHDRAAAERCDRIVELRDGAIIQDGLPG